MPDMPVRWKLKELLEQHNISTYRLWKQSGLAQATVYRLARGETMTLSAEAVNGVITALRQLTGQSIDVADLIEYQEPTA